MLLELPQRLCGTVFALKGGHREEPAPIQPFGDQRA